MTAVCRAAFNNLPLLAHSLFGDLRSWFFAHLFSFQEIQFVSHSWEQGGSEILHLDLKTFSPANVSGPAGKETQNGFLLLSTEKVTFLVFLHCRHHGFLLLLPLLDHLYLNLVNNSSSCQFIVPKKKKKNVLYLQLQNTDHQRGRPIVPMKRQQQPRFSSSPHFIKTI